MATPIVQQFCKVEVGIGIFLGPKMIRDTGSHI